MRHIVVSMDLLVCSVLVFEGASLTVTTVVIVEEWTTIIALKILMLSYVLIILFKLLRQFTIIESID